MCDVSNACGCRAVVTRVYRELRDRRIADTAAFDTAATILRLHHPEVPATDARFTLATWLEGSE